jgi:hypothetical protein
MVKFHRALKMKADEDPNFHFHYVTAREMANLALAAAANATDVRASLDFRYVPAGS